MSLWKLWGGEGNVAWNVHVSSAQDALKSPGNIPGGFDGSRGHVNGGPAVRSSANWALICQKGRKEEQRTDRLDDLPTHPITNFSHLQEALVRREIDMAHITCEFSLTLLGYQAKSTKRRFWVLVWCGTRARRDMVLRYHQLKKSAPYTLMIRNSAYAPLWHDPLHITYSVTSHHSRTSILAQLILRRHNYHTDLR